MTINYNIMIKKQLSNYLMIENSKFQKTYKKFIKNIKILFKIKMFHKKNMNIQKNQKN